MLDLIPHKASLLYVPERQPDHRAASSARKTELQPKTCLAEPALQPQS